MKDNFFGKAYPEHHLGDVIRKVEDLTGIKDYVGLYVVNRTPLNHSEDYHYVHHSPYAYSNKINLMDQYLTRCERLMTVIRDEERWSWVYTCSLLEMQYDQYERKRIIEEKNIPKEKKHAR